jgi:hypothetical protein
MGTFMIDCGTPAAYAQRLASYICDPSTIRARTLDAFGKAPTLEQCRALREKAARVTVKPAPRPFPCGHSHDPANVVEYSDGKEKCLTCYNARLQAEQEKVRDRKARMAEQARIAAKRAKEAARRADIDPVKGYGLPSEIMEAVASAFGITLGELRGEARAKLYINARTVAARLLKDNGASYPMIGRRMNRDHSSIVNLLKKWKSRTEQYPYMLTVYEALRHSKQIAEQ